MNNTELEVDHIFIAVQANAPEAELLKDFGLTEASPNQHKGQGTANRRFFFENMFLELLFLTDAAEANSNLTKPTQLFERLSCNALDYSPFGICFRPKIKNSLISTIFSTWEYKPLYLPEHLSILMVSNNPLAEPMWFILPFGIAPIDTPMERRQPLIHENGLQKVTKITITQPTEIISKAAEYANTLNSFSIKQGSEHLLELTFDESEKGLSQDFRPTLPLIFHW